MGGQNSKLVLCGLQPDAVVFPEPEPRLARPTPRAAAVSPTPLADDACETVELSCRASEAGSFGCFYCFDEPTLRQLRRAILQNKLEIRNVTEGSGSALNTDEVRRLFELLRSKECCVKLLHAEEDPDYARRAFAGEVQAIRLLEKRLRPEELEQLTVVRGLPLDGGNILHAFEVRAVSRDVKLLSASRNGSISGSQDTGENGDLLPLMDVGTVRCILVRRCAGSLADAETVDAQAVFAAGMRFLAALHYRGLVHRDMKPDNFVEGCPSPDGFSALRAIDYGFVAPIADEPLDDFVGTPLFMAPFLFLLHSPQIAPQIFAHCLHYGEGGELPHAANVVTPILNQIDSVIKRSYPALFPTLQKYPVVMAMRESAMAGFVEAVRERRGKANLAVDLLDWIWRRNDEYALLVSLYHILRSFHMSDTEILNFVFSWQGNELTFEEWSHKLRAADWIVTEPLPPPRRRMAFVDARRRARRKSSRRKSQHRRRTKSRGRKSKKQ